MLKNKLKQACGLCHRCEFRALFLERGSGPRCECGSTGAVHGCYMYKPVKPFVVKPEPGEKRNLFIGASLSGRMNAAHIALGEYKIKKQKGNFVVYFDPEEIKK